MYAALVDKHETSRGLISGRANFHERSRRLTNFSLSIFEKALSFKLRSTGWTALPACLPLPDSNLFPPFLCPFKHFRLRVLILLCKSTNESFENIVIAIEIFSRILKRIAIRTYSCVEIYEFFILGKKLCIKYAPRRNGGTVIFYDLIDTDDR